MPALTDVKLEAFAQALLRNIARGLTRGKAAEAAAKEAGYTGSSLGPNARKRAGRPDVKARMVELAAPVIEAKNIDLVVDLDGAVRRMSQIIMADVDLDSTKVPDVIAATRQLSALRGWDAAAQEPKPQINVFDLLPIEDQRLLLGFIQAHRREREAAAGHGSADPGESGSV